MTILRMELEVRDYDLWRKAFGEDQAGRERSGMRRYTIYRAVADGNRVMLDGEFDDAATAQQFLDIMRTKVWPDPAKAPAKIGQPRTSIVELAEAHEYRTATANGATG